MHLGAQITDGGRKLQHSLDEGGTGNVIHLVQTKGALAQCGISPTCTEANVT